jgi:hypothetical protein
VQVCNTFWPPLKQRFLCSLIGKWASVVRLGPTFVVERHTHSYAPDEESIAQIVGSPA